MGTSKRHLNDKIRKLIEDRNLEDLNEDAPQISRVILSKESLNTSLGDEETISKSINIVTKHMHFLGKNGFNGKSRKEVFENKITLQEFLEMVLEEIDTETSIDSKILKSSLSIVMANISESDSEDPYIFAQLLFYQVINKLLEKELYETLKDSYEELPYDKIKAMVGTLTNRIMNEKVYQEINNFVDKKNSLSNLLDMITSATTDAEFGEF